VRPHHQHQPAWGVLVSAGKAGLFKALIQVGFSYILSGLLIKMVRCYFIRLLVTSTVPQLTASTQKDYWLRTKKQPLQMPIIPV